MEALGMIETKGLSALIEASDVMLKSANVKLASYEKTGQGIVSVFIRGSVADCKLAVDAAVDAAGKVGEVLRSHVIPYPYKDVNSKLPVNI
jgi:microcompartment protein CcmL/EutN